MMKHKTLFILTVFSLLSLGVTAQDGIRTAELELNPPADAENAGRFRFSFATGNTEWIPIRRITSLQDLAEVSAQQNQEKGTAELEFSMMGEIDMRKVEIIVLSESEIKSILSTGILPEKDATTKPQAMKPDSWYILKDETNQSFYVFKLKDYSPGYVWQQIAYVRIGEGESWKGNPDLAALLDVPKAIDGLKTITVTGSGVPNLAEGKVKEVEVVQKDLKAYYPAAAKAGDFVFFSQGKSPVQPNGRSFKKEMLQAGCDYFDGVDAYPGEGDTLLLSLNKRCAAIPDEKVESLCKDPAKLVGDYCGVPMDIAAAEQPMVLLETSSKKLFLIIGLDTVSKVKITYLKIPSKGISKEQANEIREYRSLQKRKTNAVITRRQLIQESDRKEAERKQAEMQAEQDALNKRIESVKSSGDTFPKTTEEIKLVEDLIMSAKYEELLKLCEGKKLDFNVKSTRGDNMSLLYRALYHNSRNLNQSRLDRKNMVFEFVLNNGGAPVIFTEDGMNCVFFAARTNNKKAFDLLLKNGFDPNRKGPNGKTVLEFLVEQNIKVDPEIMNELKATTKPSLFSMVLESNADGLKKALESQKNLAEINKRDNNGKTLLDHAIKLKPDQNPDPEIVGLLLAAGAELEVKTISGILLYQKNDLLPVLWQYHDRLSEKDWEKCFNMAASYRNKEAFQFFLEKKLESEKEQGLSLDPSLTATVYGSGTKEMVDMLEAQGIKKPFWAAVKWNDLELVKEYLAAGADVNAEDKITRCNPIRFAVTRNHLEMAELLIQHGANISPDDYRRNGQTYPVATAAGMENGSKMMELLLKNGFFPDFPETPEDTKKAAQSSALYMALYKKQYETAKVLLKYGARTDVTQNKTVRNAQGQPERKDATLEEVFQNDPEALKVLGAK
jgi:FOG: Ankyrin repeat